MDCVNSWKKVFGERIPRIPPEASDGWLDVLMAEERGDDPDTLSGMKWAVNTQHTVTRHLIIRRSDIPKLALYKAAEKLHSSRKNR
jgi:hypothetical protein